MKYKIIPYLVFSFLLLSWGCGSTSRLILSGNYDQAIARSINKLKRNRNNEKQIKFLKEAFDKAQERDLDRIEFLKKEGLAGNSVEVFRIYEQIKERQEKIKPLLPLYIDEKEVSFRLINVDDELIRWKKEAAGFLYESALRLLKNGDKYEARSAYEKLAEVNRIFPGYRDVEKYMNEARNKGMNYVLYLVTNRSANLVPVEFVEELYTLDYARINGAWFTILPEIERHDVEPDHEVAVIIDIVDVGPEQVKEKEWIEKKETEDGFTYAKDERGNFITDSLGNKIKVPKYKEIQCKVIEAHQFKAATFKGKIELRDLRSNQLLDSRPLNVNFVFEHLSYRAEGNIEALSEESRKKLANRPLPFPSDFQMVMDAAREVKPVIYSYFRRKAPLLEQ